MIKKDNAFFAIVLSLKGLARVENCTEMLFMQEKVNIFYSFTIRTLKNALLAVFVCKDAKAVIRQCILHELQFIHTTGLIIPYVCPVTKSFSFFFLNL